MADAEEVRSDAHHVAAGPGGTISDALNRHRKSRAARKGDSTRRSTTPAANGVPSIITFSGNRQGMGRRRGRGQLRGLPERVKAPREDKGVNICQWSC